MSGSSRIRLSQEEIAALGPDPSQPAGPPTPRPVPQELPPGMPDSPPVPREAPPESTPPPESPPQTSDTPPEAGAEEPDDVRRWRGRIEGAHRQMWEWRRKAEALEAQMAQIREAQRPASQGPDPVAQARAQLQQEAQIAEFNQACDRTFEAGVSEYPDFQADVDRLNSVGAAQNPAFLDLVSSMPDGHRVYHALAQDVNEAGRIMRLPVGRMALELARKAVGGGNGAGVSPPQGNAMQASTRAPAPLRTIGGSSAPPPQSLEKMSMADFIRTRDREEFERRYGPAR